MPTNEELGGGFNLGDWEVLPGQGLLRRGEEEIRPEPKVLSVLLALARRDGNLVTKDELIDEVWDGKAFSDEPILRCIHLLRSHFGDKRPYRYIETLQRRGYRLIQPVELHVESEPADDTDDAAGKSVRLWRAVAAIVAIGFVAVAALNWFPRTEPAVRCLAVLPIENLSGDPANQYIADGVRSTLAHRLAELSAFTIKVARDEYSGGPREIANALDVESVLEGTLQMQGESLKVTWLITRGRDNVTIGSGEVTGDLEGVFGLQERLANAVRDELAGSQTPSLITRREPDSAAYNSFMRGMYALELRFAGDNLSESIELFKESIRLDENYGPAYLALATAYALRPDYHGAPLEENLDLAIATIEKGVSVDSSIADASGAIHGFVYYQQKEWAKSEAAYERAVNAAVVDANAFSWYSQMLANVGRLDDARDVALAGADIDPDNAVINSRIAMTFTWLENQAQAREYFERADELGATGDIHRLAHALMLLRDGQAGVSRSKALEATALGGLPADWVDPVFDALEDESHGSTARAAIEKAWAAQEVIPEVMLFARTFLGDIDGAMEIAKLLEQPGIAFSTELLFDPGLAPLRQHPDFYPLLERLGMVDYWSENGCHYDGDRVHCQPT